jgi:protein-tyrosine phosphatase
MGAIMERDKILFVCLGNICRSPSAEAVMKGIIEKEGSNRLFAIDSAGVIAVHAGEPADARMKKHARKRGYQLTSISRPVVPGDFDYFDLIVAMDDQNVRDLMAMAPNEAVRRKIVKMTDFSMAKDYDEVPDPYYGGDAGFELVIDLLEDACKGLYNHLVQ